MHDALDIAMYVVNLCTLNGTPVSNLQLQKILYYIQINFFRRMGNAAFNNTIEAWKYGPVVPDVYSKFSRYGAAKICKLYRRIDELFSRDELVLFDRVINACMSISPWELVDKSHRVGGPWEMTYQEGRKEEIPVALIRKYALQGV